MSQHDDELRRLLSDAVDDVEPRPGLDAIRARTTPEESAMNTTRNWLLGAFGAAVATAAVITGVVLVGNDSDTTAEDPGPAGSPTAPADPSEPSEPAPTSSPASPAPSGQGGVVGVYWVGDTPAGPRLYREFRQNTGGSSDDLGFAVATALDGGPDDPDYRSGWPKEASFESADFDGELVTIGLAGDLHDRPAGMSRAEAEIAVEQLIFTAQAAVQQGRVPVQLLLNGGHSDQILGVPTAEPLANGPILENLSHVSLTTPEEGQTVAGDALEVSGVANSFEANVIVRLQRFEGTGIVAEEPFMAEGWMGDQLFPFSGTLDLTGVAPGKYVLSAMTDDPSGGEEGPGAFTDTRTITVE
jgi:hypothetical protein